MAMFYTVELSLKPSSKSPNHAVDSRKSWILHHGRRRRRYRYRLNHVAAHSPPIFGVS